MEPLYDISSRYRALLDIAQRIEGDDLAEFDEALAQIEEEIAAKVDNCAVVAEMLKGEIEMIKAERDRLTSRQRTRQGSLDRLMAYVENCLRAAELSHVKGQRFEARIRRNPPSVHVEDSSAIPEEYWRTQDPVIDLGAIKKAINEGKEVAGATLTQTERLVIR